MLQNNSIFNVIILKEANFAAKILIQTFNIINNILNNI